MGLAAATVAADAPPLPSSRFGTVEVAGAPAAAGTEIEVWLDGSPLAATQTELLEGAAVYRIDVPGDRPDTPEREGPIEGEAFELRVGGAPATGSLWSQGALNRLDLLAAAGADLALSLSDGVGLVAAGAEIDVVLEVENLGPGQATGVLLEAEVPAGIAILSAGDGGEVTGSRVSWPPFALLDAGTATRLFHARLATSFPPGVDMLELTAAVAHDGSSGADPTPANDRASDFDLLDAAPDFALALSDGLDDAGPGETIVYRALVSNSGSQGATGTLLSVRIPSEVEFYSASHGGALAAGAVSWPPVPLAAGALVERSVTVRVPFDLAAEVTHLDASGTVADDGANGPDPEPGDNAAIDSDPVAHGSDLVVVGVLDLLAAADPQSLVLSGMVEVEVANRGTLAAPASALVAFSDEDRDGRYTLGVDTLLGTTIQGALGPGESALAVVEVSGTVRFLGDRLYAMIDAELEIVELDEDNNVGDDASGCALAPSTAPFEPIVERHWPPAGAELYRPQAVDSLSTPLVVQLTDDNGDGLWDARDVPDIVFVTTDLTNLLEPQVVLRAVRGDTLESIFDVEGFFPHPTAPTLLSFSGLAAGDIDRDGKPEILSTTFGPAAVNFLRAYEHNGALKWISQPFHTHPSPVGLSNRDNPTLADLDADGFAEIVVGANVFDRYGHILWVGNGGQAFQSSGNSGDRGGAISIVADLDLDGRLEVVTGATVYRHDGEVLWQSPLGDGYPAVADFDDDPRPEIVVVASGEVRLHDDDGALLWGPVPLPGSDPEAGGAPTIGDFDGDGEPEIGVAGSDVYVVLDSDGTLLWQASTQDYSSNLTGSTSFDLDGDGALEIVYRDERRLRIYRGSDGVVLFERAVSSNTWTEEPVVVDVDHDGNAEILVTSDRAPDVALPAGERTRGLFVLGDAQDRWISARGLWNQHAYTPELVDDDAGIPTSPPWSWLTHNSFRANIPPSGDPGAAPDLTASRVLIDLSGLPTLGVTVRVGNGGRTPVAPGLEVAFYDGDPEASGTLLGVFVLTAGLDPGDFEDLAAALQLPASLTGELTVVVDDDGTGKGRDRECDEANNRLTVPLDLSSLGLWLTLDDGTDSVGAGDELTYTITVHNAFPGTATGILLIDTLPENVLFLAASDAGVEAGGIVQWPAFSLAAGDRAIRTVTLRIDPVIPISIHSISNSASVSDDGSQGPDPTPANNQASDVDQVTSVTADAGGPYFAPEGIPVALDGSGSFDRDGTLVAFEWDLDADGDYDDATGPEVPWLFPGEGLWPVRLRVTDDSGESDVDATTAEIGNEPPVVLAPDELVGVEGAEVSLVGIHCTDPGDELTGRVDWGDGTEESVAVVDGVPAGSHVYGDDGSYALVFCVTDASSPEVCVERPAQIANAPPDLLEESSFGFGGWEREELGAGETTAWEVSTGGGGATELLNGGPTLFVGDRPALGTYELAVRVASPGDDDFVGFALGVEPGDLANPSASYLLVDWKRHAQSGAVPGLAISEVFGVPANQELWLHVDQAGNGAQDGVRELARAATLGGVGWARHTEYRFRIEQTPSSLKIWVDGSLEFNLVGNLPPGRLALYDYSQASAVFTALATEVAVIGFEGEPASLAVPFVDAGVLDTHSAEIDWGDGSIETVLPVVEEGHGSVAATHTFADDAEPPLAVCVTDDDGGAACAPIPTRIWNRPPELSLVVSTTGFREDPVTLDGTTFGDPGTLDTHVAAVDWGDGTLASAEIVEAGGSGSVAASHTYASPGSFALTVCLEDDDGGRDCVTDNATVVERILDLSVVVRGDVSTARPGETVGFDLELANAGSLPAAGVAATATLPDWTTLVSASDGGALASGIVTWTLGGLSVGESATRRMVVAVDPGAPFDALVATVATVADDGAAGPDGVPVDNVAVAELRISDGVTPIVELPPSLAGSEGQALALAGATWSDTTTGEGHTGTIDWGDGASGQAMLTPAQGTFGAIGGSHRYVEDGAYALRVCVRDAAGHEDCATGLVEIANASPRITDQGPVDLHYWRVEEYDLGGTHADWQVSEDGLSVYQTQNSQPSIFFSPIPAFGTRLEGVIRVEQAGAGDNDFIGFVLGYRPEDHANPAADYLLLDWKQASQNWTFDCGTRLGRIGLALSQVVGIPAHGELWGHLDEPCNGGANRVFELGRGFTRHQVSWQERRDYRFRFDFEPTRLRVWVDDTLEFDVAGSFPEGRIGFYNFSQEAVTYRGFLTTGTVVRNEGDEFELAVGFSDPGELDSHTVLVEWDDGTSSLAEVEESGGAGTARAKHPLLDDADLRVRACVEDDEGDIDCGDYPLIVVNVPPAPVAYSVGAAAAGAPWASPLATFTDPGRLDSHVASVDWGDGTSSPAEIVEDDGAGTVSGGHTWSAPGSYDVAVCVVDDDGGSGCVPLVVQVLAAPPALRAEKTFTAIDRDGDGRVGPGDDILYRIELSNQGPTHSTGVVLTDPIPAHTTFVPGSATPALLVTREDPLVVEIPSIPAGAAIAIQFAVTVDSPLAHGVHEIVNSGLVESVELPPLATDDPALPGSADPTRTPVSASGALAVAKTATLVDLDGDGVATPGDEIDWSIVITASGNRDSEGILLLDPIPAHTTLLADGVETTRGEIFALDPVVVSVGALAAGEVAAVEIRTQVESALPAEVEWISNQATVSANEVEDLLSDDPDTAELADPTRIPVYVYPTLDLADTAAPEGSSGESPMLFQLLLDRPARLPIEVDWEVLGDTAAAGVDFVAASGSAAFALGEAVTGVVVVVLGDPVVELDETLRLRLSNPVRVHLANDEAIGTIVNDDTTAIVLGDTSVVEGGMLQFPVALVAPSALPVSVAWQTADGTATAGLDYLAGSGTLHFPPLETESSIPVATLTDDEHEIDETMRLLFSQALGVELPDPESVGTILDDDPECALVCAPSVVHPSDPGACGALVDLPPPEPLGTCGAVSCDPPSGSFFPVGLATVVCSADALPAHCTLEVTVTDVEPPTVLVPSLSAPNDPGECGAHVVLLAEALDNCPEVATPSCEPGAGSFFPVGTTLVACSVADAAGNLATGLGAVEVLDLEPPAFQACPEDQEVAAPPGALSWPVDFDLPVATDNCPEVAAACAPPPGGAFPVGLTTVICMATDAAGGQAACDFDVDVRARPPVEIPALSARALALFALLLLLAGLALRRRDGRRDLR